MTVTTLKKRIVKKFGSVSRFCNVAGLNKQNLDNLFRLTESKHKQARLKELAQKVKETEDKELAGELTDELLEQIRVAIVTKNKSYQEFCEKHKISNTWLSALLNGKHRLISGRVRSLCETLNINHEKACQA